MGRHGCKCEPEQQGYHRHGGLSTDQSTCVLELMGHAKGVTTITLLDPAAAEDNQNGPVLLASVSAGSTLRV